MPPRPACRAPAGNTAWVLRWLPPTLLGATAKTPATPLSWLAEQAREVAAHYSNPRGRRYRRHPHRLWCHRSYDLLQPATYYYIVVFYVGDNTSMYTKAHATAANTITGTTTITLSYYSHYYKLPHLP